MLDASLAVAVEVEVEIGKPDNHTGFELFFERFGNIGKQDEGGEAEQAPHFLDLASKAELWGRYASPRTDRAG